MNREQARKIISEISKVIAFALAFALILCLVSFKAFSGDNTAKYSGRLADAYLFVNDPEQTTDVMFVGNSDAYSGFIPTALWENYGITSAVSASPHQNVQECKNALQTMLETQSPKVVVLETDMLYDGEENGDGSELSKYARFFSETVNPEAFESNIKSRLTLFTYHNAWKYLRGDKSNRYSHGYKYISLVYDIEPTDYMQMTDDVHMPVKSNLSALDDFVSFCKSRNISLVFAEVNSAVSWNMAKHNAMCEIAKSYDVDFIDFNLMYDELNIDMATAFRDNGYHVSYDTALKITDYMGEYFVREYQLEDHRDDVTYSEYWNLECEGFKRENKIS